MSTAEMPPISCIVFSWCALFRQAFDCDPVLSNAVECERVRT